MISVLAVALATVFDVVAGHYDASISEEGFAKGYEEANERITSIFKTKKPSYFDLSLYNYFFAGLFAAAGFAFHSNYQIVTASCVVLAVDGAKHLLAVRQWRKAFETNGASLNASKTAWQKLLGI